MTLKVRKGSDFITEIPIEEFMEKGQCFIALIPRGEDNMEIVLFMKKETSQDLKEAGAYCYQLIRDDLSKKLPGEIPEELLN